jgi:tetratricopeptide (TPR) repeat protein
MRVVSRLPVVFFFLMATCDAIATDEPHPLYLYAEQRLNAQLWLEGAHALDDYLKEYPDDYAARMQASSVYYQLGMLRQAADHASVVYRESGQHADARRMLIRIRTRLARELDHDDSEAVLYLARLSGMLDNVDRASAYFAQAWALTSEPAVLLEWARLFHWAGRAGDAEPLYEEYARWRPTDIKARHETAQIYNALERHERAVRELRELLHFRPRDPVLEVDLARSLLWSGDTQEAENVLINLLRRHPSNLPARELLASMYHQEQAFRLAYDAYLEILRFKPDHREALWRKGEYERKRYLEIASLRESLRVNPDQPTVRAELVHILLEENRLSDALYEMDYFLALHPDDRAMRSLRAEVEEEERARVANVVHRTHALVRDGLDSHLRAGRRWIQYHPDDLLSMRKHAQIMLMAKEIREASWIVEHWPDETASDPYVERIRRLVEQNQEENL